MAISRRESDKKTLMNVLVTGANGQLGMHLRELASRSGDRYVFTCLHGTPEVETVYLDICNGEALDLICRSEDIDVIVNCSAYNDVNKAEDDVSMANMVNRTGVENLAAAALKYNAVLIHISTDYVFDGRKNTPYCEQDAPAPLGVYGESKLSGERAIIESGCKYFIFRTSWMYSGYRKNFYGTMVSLLESPGEVKVVCDQVGTPTYAGDLAEFIFGLISARRVNSNFGLYHYSDEGVASWYDFACAIARLRGLPGKVLPCLSVEYRQKAARPHYSVLDKSLVKKTFGVGIPHWEESLEKFVKLQK